MQCWVQRCIELAAGTSVPCARAAGWAGPGWAALPPNLCQWPVSPGQHVGPGHQHHQPRHGRRLRPGPAPGTMARYSRCSVLSCVAIKRCLSWVIGNFVSSFSDGDISRERWVIFCEKIGAVNSQKYVMRVNESFYRVSVLFCVTLSRISIQSDMFLIVQEERWLR